MTSAIALKYPGDEPATLAAAAEQIDMAGVRVERLIEAITLSRAALKKAWTMQATDLADADIGTLIAGLPTVRTALTTAGSAVTTHRDTLTRIRLQVDELRAALHRHENAFVVARQDYQKLEQRDDAAAVAQQNEDVARAKSAAAALQDIIEQYQQLIQHANASAETCAAAMTTAWDPQHRALSAFGLMLTDPGRLLLDEAGLGADTLNMLRIDAEVAEASSLAAEIDAMQYIDATDPAVQAKFARLAEIWNAESANGVFATEFYDKLGADDTVDVLARIGTVLHPVDGDLDTGPLNQALIHDLQTDMANGLSAAMQGIELDGHGKLQDTLPGGLSADWVDSLMERGRTEVTVPWNDMPIQVKGYVPLMATLAAGSGYTTGVLQAIGEDMRAMELGDGDNGPGASVWTDTAPTRVRWNWSAGGYDFPMGSDPMTSWTTAMTASPGAAVRVLANDVPLLNYLLNDRDWTLRDSGDNFGSTQWHYRIADDHERLEGLSHFGDALPEIIGAGTASPDPAKAFDNTVHLLGSRGTNPRIDAGLFHESDWIPPELRPGLGDLLVLNSDKLNEVMANSAANDTSVDVDYYRVLADVAKDPAPRDGTTFIDRMIAAEKTTITAEMSAGTFNRADLDAQARIAAIMAHGHVAHDLNLQQEADAAHNGTVSKIAGAAELALDTSAAPLKWTKEIYKAFGGDIIQVLAGNFMQDTSLATVGDNADWSSALRSSVNNSAADEWYSNGFDALPAPDPAAFPNVHLYDSAGTPLPWSHLDQNSRNYVATKWPTGVNDAPELYGSGAMGVFDEQGANLQDRVLHIPDGTH